MPPAVLVEIRKEVGFAELAYSNSKIPLADVYKMYASNLFLRAEAPVLGKKGHKNVFNEVYKQAQDFFNKEGCLGIRKMLHLQRMVKISPSIARGKLLNAFCQSIYLGDFVAMDEKQKKW